MALIPKDARHALQITAGTVGRQKGHDFEQNLTLEINTYTQESELPQISDEQHLFLGKPGPILISYIMSRLGLPLPKNLKAWWLGGLATSNSGDELTDAENNRITKSKSDIVIDFEANATKRIGISVKTCYAKSPTNDQLFFTTALAFCGLLRNHNIEVSKAAEDSLRMFCGDAGFRPQDMGVKRKGVDPTRWFWEELPIEGKNEWEKIFTEYQKNITEILFRKGYKNEPITPEFLIHLTRGYSSIEEAEFALFSIDELVQYSKEFAGFHTREYRIRKGSYKHDPNTHLAPRFGFIQMQRGGQKQHPTQLQFNLMAGYFYHLPTQTTS